MNKVRPTVPEERWLVLADRYPALQAAVEQQGKGGGWKTSTWLGRCLGFVLGLVGSGMLAGVLSLGKQEGWLLGGLILVVAAEWMMAQRRVFHTGVEEALYLCGAIAIAIGLLPGDNEPLNVALIATAVLLAGWRLLNPLFTTLAAAGYSLAISWIGGSRLGGSMHTREAAFACVLFAVGALVAGGRTWRRPSHDWMFDGLVIAMPWLAYGWLVEYKENRSPFWILDLAVWPANGGLAQYGSTVTTDYVALAVALAFLVLNLFIGVRRRQHAPLIGALGNLACVAYSIHQMVPWPMHWQLIAAGAVLLAVAVLLERLLRHRSKGITSRAIEEPAGVDVVQLVGAADLSPAPGSPPPAGVQGQGGEFGGGGASGRF